MDFSVNKLKRNVQHLIVLIEALNLKFNFLHDFLRKKNYESTDIEILLQNLSRLLLDEQLTIPIATAFEDCLLLLIANAVECNDAENDVHSHYKAIALSKLMHLSLCTKRYAMLYFLNKPPPFTRSDYEISSKKYKTTFNKKPDELAIVKCCFYLLKSDTSFFKDLWNWSEFLLHYVDRNDESFIYKVYTNHIIAMLTNMNASTVHKLNKKIPEEILIQFNEEQDELRLLNLSPMVESDMIVTSADDNIKISEAFSQFVTNIEGVFLPTFNRENYEFFRNSDNDKNSIIRVESTRKNLQSIALGVHSGRAICLSGPVGSGKTTLVEYLARMTGRIPPKKPDSKKEFNSRLQQEKTKAELECKQNISYKRKLLQNENNTSAPANGFLRIQLSDQTDSKMLLGQYHCTDVPGEFLWLPGVLTQAVMNGYWLLLEDLDCATTDTFTVLSSLLENNYLSVPGFRDCVKVTPGFQLFITVRTHKTLSSKWSQKALFSLLEKHIYPINILPLSRNELCEVISRKYSKLATVANRMVDVFLTFSSGAHDVFQSLQPKDNNDNANLDSILKLPFDEVCLPSNTNSGRLVSTRDLIKFCQRLNPTFSVTSTECAKFVFKNAVDIFCSYLPNTKEKTKLIIGIGAKLGITQSRCEHLANEFKPEIHVDSERITVEGRCILYARSSADKIDMIAVKGYSIGDQPSKRLKLLNGKDRVVHNFSSKCLPSKTIFSFTRLASCLLERIAVCVANAEPVLLVGETGVGKTSSVQYLATKTNHKLIVVNMNNQSDISDLVGGFKPVDLVYVIKPMRIEFEFLFRNTYIQSKNESFLRLFTTCYNQGNFSVIVKLMSEIVNDVCKKSESNELKQKVLLPRWMAFKIKLQKLKTQLSKSINMSFAFIPGSLVNCIKNGDWILLDEINLASADTLECLSTILEPDGSVVLLEKGDFTPVQRHADFRIFACMNPNTDIGKKDLPVGIRNRFTEFYVDEVETDADLRLLVTDYLRATGIQKKSVFDIVKLYKSLKLKAMLELNDGLGNRPIYSLRTLCRSLTVCAKNLCGSIERNLFESFCLSFLTQLDVQSHKDVQKMIENALLSNVKAVLHKAIPQPGETYINFQGYWIERGPKEIQDCTGYILTESVKENLKDLARIISIGKFPILLQGPTSAGKTSLIDYVAKRSGNHCLRINNHEHTDLQEYVGSYTTDVTGKLVFKEGILVQAMRHGYWIILDELNLASTEILEALNRVLDDNREIFIPETQTIIKAHENFMLFATQNPPGLYGGRKTLSRAFKNRFIELHFSDIPRSELEIILEKKCLIPASYARKMVACMVDLQKNRKSTSKNSFTLRDLFRWGIRYTLADKKLLDDQKYDWNQHLVEEGYLVLSARVRTEIELEVIHETLYKNFRKEVNLSRLFDTGGDEEKSLVTKYILDEIIKFKSCTDIVWTRNMTRMAVFTAKALQFNEPVLLIGPTGCGKTTVCQLLASIRKVELRILNCHMHTEGADFLGGLRPCRTSNTDEGQSKKIFEWADGPLIQSMQDGSYFMADEISLAEDSVLERLNSILEPERTILLAEKCGIITENQCSEGIAKGFLFQANPGFQFLATMNPSGDFGKKELSPALRNRFTEIWCQPSSSRDDLIAIANNCILNQLRNLTTNKQDIFNIASFIVNSVLYIKNMVSNFKFSVRDILAMANYISTNTTLSFPEKAIYGLETTFLDALEMSFHESPDKLDIIRNQIIEYAIIQADEIIGEKFTLADVLEKKGTRVEYNADNTFGIKPFFIGTNIKASANILLNTNKNFLFEAPTTKQNLFRLLSALSLNKPILLEGPPGVGKTSIVESLAQAIGYNIVRINLCENTDLADLFGTDLPVEDNLTHFTLEKDNEDNQNVSLQIGAFQWRDGPLLAALRENNTWILLDELNLAPQSVLEGLNAILDHRGEVYIPELNKTFALNKQARVFACQNPLKQGGGRKGLPQSFLNRFTKVYVKKLTTDDLLYVVEGKYKTDFDKLRNSFFKLLPSRDHSSNNLFDIYESAKEKKEAIAEKVVNNGLSDTSLPHEFDLTLRLVRFSEILDNGISTMEFGYKGGPFEINLRDLLLWCDLLLHPKTGFVIKQGGFLRNFYNFLLTLYERMQLVYSQRMRSNQDKQFIKNAFGTVFQCDSEYLNSISEDVAFYYTDEKIYLNDIILNRDSQSLRFRKPLEDFPLLLESQRETLKALVECVHIEKPIILCGSTDTGKTKIVDTLCCISNQVCNLDNIDDSVTGSFQQIDLNRHLEEISYQVECIYLKFIQNTILDSSTVKIISELLDSWNTFSVLRNYKCDFKNNSYVNEELMNYRRRIDKLYNVIEVIQRYLQCPVNEKDIEELQFICNKLNLLKCYVKNINSLNTGGCFEWVDSKIVKSLKNGQYILLEHVNLCSSAVLDRLNPIFEPSGTLMLSEKGVTGNDNAEIVKKAENFRAFLTLDHKNGELSRAMRNRCVEIFMNNWTPSLDDKRKLVFNQGVCNIGIINCIISIHDNISKLTELNNLSISHLEQTAFLCASYKQIGYQIKMAIYMSALEVYVYSATTDLMGYGLDFYQNKLKEIIEMAIKNLTYEKYTSQQNYFKDTVLKCCSLSEISLVNFQILPLKIILDNLLEPNQIKDALSTIFSDFKDINMENFNFNELAKYLIYIVYETCSLNDLRFRYLQLEKYLKYDQMLLELSRTLHNCIVNFDNKDIDRMLPWNSKMYPRIRDYKIETFEKHGFCLSSSLIINMLMAKIPQEPISKMSVINVLAYSQAVANKTLNDKVNNFFIGKFSEYIFILRKVVKTNVNVANFNFESYTNLITAIQWFNRILNVSKLNLYINKEINTDLLDKLVLHFKWLDKYLIRLINILLPNIKQISPELHNCHQQILNYIKTIKHPLDIRRKIYGKHLLEYQPFSQEQQVKSFIQIQKLNQFLCITPLYGNLEPDDLIKKFIVRKSESARIAYAIMLKSYTEIDFRKIREITLNNDYENVIPDGFKCKLQQFLQCLVDNSNNDIQISHADADILEFKLNGIAQMFSSAFSPETLEVNSLNMPHEIELSTQAIIEYFLMKYLIANLESSTIMDAHINCEYEKEMPFLNSTTISLLNVCKQPYYAKYRDFWLQLSEYINQIDSCKEFKELLLYLNGGYKHLSALSRLISYSVQKFQLESLNSHPECIQIKDLKYQDSLTSKHAYKGPAFTALLSKLLFVGASGVLKVIPLCDLNIWRTSTSQLCQIMWHNSALITPKYSMQWNNYLRALRSAKRLLVEVKYLDQFSANDDVENLTKYTQSFYKLISKLNNFFTKCNEEHIPTTFDSIGNQLMLYNASLLNTFIGSIELCLIPFTPLIDPVEKNQLKHKYLTDDIHCLNNFKTAYDFLRISMKYKTLGDELYEALSKNLFLLKERQDKLMEKVALRPNQCLYSSLVKDITHFFTTNCNPEVLLKIINNVESTFNVLLNSNNIDCINGTLESYAEIINKLNLWIANSQRFLHHTLKPYSHYYQDFLYPLQCSIQQLQFGFEGLKVALVQIKNSIIVQDDDSYININANNKLHKVLKNISEFPSNQMLNIFNVNSSKDILKNRCPVFSILSKIPSGESDYFHLLKAKVVELRNRVQICQFINQELFDEFDYVFNIINQIWQREEELRQQKQKEDDSLYLTKTKCTEEDNEVLELKEIQEIFPTMIHEDFGDFLQDDTLEGIINFDTKQQKETKRDTVIVQENDYSFIVTNFINILVKSSQTRYHPTPKVSNNNDQLLFDECFLKRFQVFVRVFNNYKCSINEWLDEECFNSLFFGMSIQKDILNDHLLSGINSQKMYNFYKDPNISEILLCTDVLDSIEQRINEQLEIYPEHATLIDIRKIIQRIRLLPSTAPVVRFNAGFQILRQNVALWNEVAHKNNNLKPEEQKIAEFVKKWTSMELQFWRNSLTLIYEKVECTASKYWFFIYNLIHEGIAEGKVDHFLTNINSTMKRFEKHEVFEPAKSDITGKDVITAKKIINILRQFIESSSFGDFCVRMKMLLAFEHYLHNVVNYSAKASRDAFSNEQIWDLISGIRNLQLYFDQFSGEIEEHKKFIRTLIEKKLKELVKIESYNKDLSYISMRNNIARVHRNLNKYLREYEQGLKEKITSIFQAKDATVKDYIFAKDKEKELRFGSKIKYYVVDSKYFLLRDKNNKNEFADNQFVTDSRTLLSKANHLFKISRSLVKDTLTNVRYPKLVIALDTFLIEQLEKCDYLRNLTVDRTKERSKQKLEAKQILQQKRKALKDLFEALATLGVNHKTGLMELSINESVELEDMLLPPFCIKTTLINFKEKHTQPLLLQLNANVDLYFNKSIFKMKLLRNIMLTPLSELGPPNIERIKGYGVDLFLLVQNQRRLLATTANNIYDYGIMLQQLRVLNDMNSKTQLDESHMNFSKFRDQFDVLKVIIARIRYVFEQLKLYCLHVPCDNQTEIRLFVDANGESVNKNSIDICAILTKCDQILSFSKTTLTNLHKENSEFVFKDCLNSYRNSFNQLYKSIQDILEDFKTYNNEYLPIAKPLIELSTYVHKIIVDAFNDTNEASSDCSINNVDLELEALINSVLYSIQEFSKKYKKKEQQTKSMQESYEDDAEQLEDGHLKKKLYGDLNDDWNLMRMDKINKQFMNILLRIKLSKPSAEKIEHIKKLLSIQPILEQFNLVTEYLLYQQLAAHKVSVKIVSIILTVFIEIGTKGFCIPPDLLQDEEGNTKKDQKEGESFGLEDGTGEKDASDKIESEDQLDDAKRPEDRKEEQDKNESNDCKEEKGIEMSENFDGEMQDIEKQNNEEDDSGESENEKDLDKEMGETEEGAEKLDDQIWGDDETPDDLEDEKEMKEEENGKGNNEEQDAHNDLNSKNDSPNDNNEADNLDNDGLDATNEQNGEKQKQKDKDIDDKNLDEECDQDQVNPYHNELEEPEEAEDFNLEDLNVNEDDEKDESQQNEVNPFDIDNMKENMQDVDKSCDNQDEEDAKENQNNDNDDDDSSDDNDLNSNDKSELQDDKDNENEKEDEQLEEKCEENSNEQNRSLKENGNSEEEEKENINEKSEEIEQSKDQPMNEDNMQSFPEIESKGSKDQVETEKTNNDVQQDQNMDEQDTGEEREGIGQAENEHTDGGHQGVAETRETLASESNKTDIHPKENKNPRMTDEDRSLGKADQNKIKRLKTIDKLNEDDATQDHMKDSEETEMEVDEYQHVKEPKMNDSLTLDNATDEQSKKIQHQSEEEEILNKEDDLIDENQSQLNEDTEEHNDASDLQQIQAEKVDKKSEKPLKFEQKSEFENVQEQFDVEGEIIKTITALRNDDTTAHCNTELLADKSGDAEELNSSKTLELRRMYQDQVTQQQPKCAQNEDHETWSAISTRMVQNARELCEQLRLILEPTKCTRLKGDYRTGRRINMKKIIPYIASQFRKDKIWLRRTKPAQRDYKITIAIDDSKSMHHNNSKVLTLEAISLVSQSLTLLESGRLSVISFGEQPKILLNHSEQFDGPKLVNSLQFSQDKTKIAQLLDFIRTANTEDGLLGTDNGIFENLLLILSDGRNIFSEGEIKVKNSVKLARLQRIFIVYIIIDNPENKDSILDIQTIKVLENKSINIKSYLEDFPFPYYVIVRDLNQLPTVLSDAMRQWFELVNSEQ